ncbi:MAG: hypothetical protein CMJ85_12310 [Planctomycetes bacterium]|nr:hypothetical protein [Planctomycetota bacterium]
MPGRRFGGRRRGGCDVLGGVVELPDRLERRVMGVRGTRSERDVLGGVEERIGRLWRPVTGVRAERPGVDVRGVG